MFLHNKKTTHNSTTLINTYSKNPGPKFKDTNTHLNKKKKIMLKHNLIQSENNTQLHHPHKILLQNFWAQISILQVQNQQKKEKEFSYPFLHNKETTHNSTTLSNTYSRVLGANF